MWQYWSHLKYTTRHKYYVLIECIKEGIILRGITHDLSKFTPSEFSGYANFFFYKNGSKKSNTHNNSDEIKKAFDMAFDHHQNSNDHHWRSYISDGRYDNSMTFIREMPHDAAIEMVCDWIGAAKANYENEPDIPLPWYKKNRHKMLLHTHTRKLIEEKIGFKNGK